MKPIRTVLLSACLLLTSGTPAHALEPSSSPDAASPGDSKPIALFPDTRAGQLLSSHLDAMVAVGEDVEARYQESLRLIQKEPESLKLLADAYGLAPESEYFLRWQLVYAIGTLQQPEARKVLATIAFSEIPPERSEDRESSTVGRESNIRVAAVDGLAMLARSGNVDAESDLLELCLRPDLSTRQRAVRGYLAAGRDYEARARTLQDKLPRTDHWLITLEVTDVRTVPHPDDTPDDLKPRERVRDGEAPSIPR